jgi:hypothetical protein
LTPSSFTFGGLPKAIIIAIYVGREVLAQFLNGVGFWYYGERDYKNAFSLFVYAANTYPGHTTAMYKRLDSLRIEDWSKS